MTQYSDHHGPEGLLVRGTIIVVPGRGETRATYARFGGRLAADAYRVRVIDPPALDAEDPTASLTGLAARLAEAVEGTSSKDGVVRPVVLVGADSGAAALAALLGGAQAPAAWWPDALVLMRPSRPVRGDRRGRRDVGRRARRPHLVPHSSGQPLPGPPGTARVAQRRDTGIRDRRGLRQRDTRPDPAARRRLRSARRRRGARPPGQVAAPGPPFGRARRPPRRPQRPPAPLGGGRGRHLPRSAAGW